LFEIINLDIKILLEATIAMEAGHNGDISRWVRGIKIRNENKITFQMNKPLFI
jgi:hypothetical protein